jgi:hypothetical protein
MASLTRRATRGSAAAAERRKVDSSIALLTDPIAPSTFDPTQGSPCHRNEEGWRHQGHATFRLAAATSGLGPWRRPTKLPACTMLRRIERRQP